jgi:hypothetical protein
MLPLFLSFGSHISEPTDLWQTRIDAAVPSQIDGGRGGGGGGGRGGFSPRSLLLAGGYRPLRPSDSVRYSSAVSVSTPDALPVVPTSNMRVSLGLQDQLAAEYLSPEPE